jgi:glycosyltransferase involved in cell wall biosynthesis
MDRRSPPGALRVTMFVLNDMRLDSRVRREACTLAAEGYDVTVYGVLSDATAAGAREAVDGYVIVRVPMLMHPASEADVPRGGAPRSWGFARRAMASAFVATRPLFGGSIHFLANWQLRWRLWARRVMERVEPSDVWHAHDLNTLPLAIDCAERFGGAVVYDSHEVFTEAGATSQLPAPARALLRRLERRWARRAAAVITVNNSLAEVLRESLDTPDITVVHNCATAPADRLSPLRERIEAVDGERVVLYHGSMTIGRGLESLVAAFADSRLAGVHLAFMGYGPLRPRVQALAKASPASGRIHFLPPVPPAEVTTWVAGCDVAVMPIEPTTLNHRLSSPNKLFEAIAAGVPVVGPDFVEFRRIVHGSDRGSLGDLHASHAPSAIATSIHTILALPPEEYAGVRQRCRAAADARWNWGNEGRQLVGVYARLAASSARVELLRRQLPAGAMFAVTPETD